MTKKLIDVNAEVVTTCGKPARIICTDRKIAGGLSIVALIDSGDNCELIVVFDVYGELGTYGYRLINKPVVKALYNLVDMRGSIGVALTDEPPTQRPLHKSYWGYIRRTYQDGVLINYEVIKYEQ